MSAILSAEELNDFISPGVACIKPIESVSAEKQNGEANPYEVTTEEKAAAANPTPAQISLTDCLACSGCVTSAEAVLVSLQSHQEVLDTLDANPSLYPSDLAPKSRRNGYHAPTKSSTNGVPYENPPGKLFVASISPQAKASIAAAHGISFTDAGHLIDQLLSGPEGIKTGGNHHSSFAWVVDTNALRSASLVLAYEEATSSSAPKKPVLASACPGWICYAEKTHPHLLPNLSAVKSPQSISGALLKSVLSRAYGISPSQIWHLAVMPCFDKKLEASRGELTSVAWAHDSSESAPVRDVDCVITPRELLQIASIRNIDFAALPHIPVSHDPFPDPALDTFLFPSPASRLANPGGDLADPTGTSGGYLAHIAKRVAASLPGSRIRVDRGRNTDVLDIVVEDRGGQVAWKGMRCYGFRNIQNLVRKMKPKTSRLLGARKLPVRKTDAASDYAYVEVMACPGGCTNGGGQIRVTELQELGLRKAEDGPAETTRVVAGPKEQKEWLAKVDEAYFSSSDNEAEERAASDRDAMEIDTPAVHAMTNGNGVSGNGVNGNHQPLSQPNADADIVDGISRTYVLGVMEHWTTLTGVPIEKLAFTTYREVESDVGKTMTDTERVAGLANSIGGGW